MSTFLLALLLAQLPDGGPAKSPQFEDFAAEPAYKGTPASPLVKTNKQRTFRTMIREGAKKGPNFNGHFTVAMWGCGAGCQSGALVDAKTGDVFDLPFAVFESAQPMKYEGRAWNEAGFEPIVFKLSSRLLVARGCPEGGNCASYYYEFASGRFRLINKVPAAPIEP